MSKDSSTQGTIFNVQHYSIHDGPGIRTTVFLNGCPLRCLWCQNPESQSLRPQLFFSKEKCTGCGTCVKVCPEEAIHITGDRAWTDRERCQGTGKCIEACPNEARNIIGRHISAQEVFEEVAADAIFYGKSGGGVTLSGGEPLFQPQFVINLLKLCREASISTALETSGFAKWEIFKEILKDVDLVLYDFKHMDPTAHERGTGVANDLILANVKKIHHELQLPIWARVPIIPGYNDSKSNIEATARFIVTELGESVKVNLLPYHRLGEAKYDRLEKYSIVSLIQSPSEEQMLELLKIVQSFGLIGQIGG